MLEEDRAGISYISLWRLKLMAFLSGAVLMSLEMAGVRILNVYFGTTIYVWGAIIGIFLGALSLGYYIGGIVADRYPRFSLLGVIILITAFFVFLVPFIAKPVCTSLMSVKSFDPRIQALLGSIILYFIPSVFLGMVSPFAVRLAAHEVKDIGHVAGRLYAISTLGSIFGTFVTTFVLVEFMGMRAIIWSLGVVLTLASLLSFSKIKNIATTAVIGFILATLSFSSMGEHMVTMPLLKKIIEDFDSPYHHIVVAEGPALVNRGKNARYLLFNTQIQSGLLTENKDKVVTACGYLNMTHLGMVFRDSPAKKALIIGCGGGIGPMVFKQDYNSIEKIDVVDIDSKVFEMANKYFRYPLEDDVIKSHITDGRRFVRNSPENYYDYVILDAYSSGGRVPFHLLTKEFFELTKKVMEKDGVLDINLISAVEGEKSELLKAVKKTLSEVYRGGNIYIFPRDNPVYYNQNMNINIVCTTESKRYSVSEIIEMLKKKHRAGEMQHYGLRSYIRNLLPEDKPLPGVLVTDNYAPLDSMVRR